MRLIQPFGIGRWALFALVGPLSVKQWLRGMKQASQYRGFDYPRLMKTMAEPHEGDTWWCRGKVTNKYVEGDKHCVDCDIRIENAKGEVTTPGKATVVLPSRG